MNLPHPPAGGTSSAGNESPAVPPVARPLGFDPVAALARMNGAEALFLRVTEAYLASAPAARQRLDAAVKAKQSKAAARAAHAWRGAAATFSARALESKLRALETSAVREDWAAVVALYADIEVESAAFEADLLTPRN